MSWLFEKFNVPETLSKSTFDVALIGIQEYWTEKEPVYVELFALDTPIAAVTPSSWKELPCVNCT